jgi:hypothetical protein
MFFFILVIYLLLFSNNGKRAKWNHFLHGVSVQYEGDIYIISILTDIMIWRLLFSDDDIKADIVSPPWTGIFILGG